MHRYIVEATFRIEVSAKDTREAQDIAIHAHIDEWDLWSGPTVVYTISTQEESST